MRGGVALQHCTEQTTKGKAQMAFEQHCIVELFGHQKIAGKVTEQQIGGASFIRVDIPATPNREGFTKFYHPNAVYAMTPVDEDIAKKAAANFDQAPVKKWELALPAPTVEYDPERDEDGYGEDEGEEYVDEGDGF